MSMTPPSPDALVGYPAGPTHAPLPPAPPPLADYWSAPLRRWPLTLAGLLVSVAAGAGVAHLYGQKLWQVEGTIIYTPLPIAESHRADYTPPSPKTLLALVRSPQRLEGVVQELGLPVSARSLDGRVKTTPHATADAVTLTLDWHDPAVGREIVDRLMQAHIRDVAALRRDKIREGLTMLAAERADAAQRLETARAAYDALPAGSDGPRLAAEVGRLSAVAAALATELNLIRGRLNLCRDQLARVREREEAVAAGRPDPDHDDSQHRDRRQALLDGIRAKEEDLRLLDSQVAAKQKEVASAEQLTRAGAGSRQEHVRAAGELDLLLTRRRNAEAAVRDQRQELADLSGSRLRTDRAALEREEGQLDRKAAAIDKALAENLRETAALGEKTAAEQKAARRLDRADADHAAVVARITALERLANGPAAEFAVAHPAAASAEPTSSNCKSLAVLTGGAVMSVLLLALVAHAGLTRPRPAGPPAGGLPVLAAAEEDGPAGRAAVGRSATEARRIALALRDPVHRSGGLVLFTATEPSVPTRDVVCQLARYLSLWGEAVLIVDARTAETGEPDLSDLLLPGLSAGPADSEEVDLGSPAREGPSSGLYHYLKSPTLDAAFLIQNTSLDGVRYLPAGSLFPDPDRLASAAMHRLLVQLSAKYDRVLLLGPALDDPPGAEILAGYVDGAVVSFRRGGADGPDALRAIRAIRDAGVPWVGAVIRSGSVAGPESRLALRSPRPPARRNPPPRAGGESDVLGVGAATRSGVRRGGTSAARTPPPARSAPADDEVSYSGVDDQCELDRAADTDGSYGGESDVLSAAWGPPSGVRLDAGPASRVWEPGDEALPFAAELAEEPEPAGHGLYTAPPAWTVQFVGELGLTRASRWDAPPPPVADQLAGQEPRVAGVPRAEPAGVRGDPPGPLQPGPLDPPWGAADPAHEHLQGRPELK